mmetsp:Transcript_18234/g.22336  ORF Transcript_18234/g.22336 Transcript_18234/m.22336 type:complete len:531 (+) Transcript_18234:56-1648(+)
MMENNLSRESTTLLALDNIKCNSLNSLKGDSLSSSVISSWESIPADVRRAIVSLQASGKVSGEATPTVSMSSTSSTSSINEDATTEAQQMDCAGESSESGVTTVFTPLERAPDNVFSFKKHIVEESNVMVKSSSAVTTKTKVITSGRGWRNIFTLPISYDVNMVARGTIFDPANAQLLHSTGVHSEGYNRRFATIDAEVDKIYGSKIRAYFTARNIELTTFILNGGEAEKRTEAVDKLLDALCAYKLRRREPFLAIGGGVLLDMAGMAACLYRRGVPFVRVPTTLLALVDASVGVKNGVDYCCSITDETYKNRVGSFYAPSSCLLDSSFIATQDSRNIANGFGEILKLALVRSSDLFDLLEAHGSELIRSRFQPNSLTPPGVSDRIIDLSIQIMLEELGPNLWETKLDRCVDYGHTFSKLLEMVPGADIFHGEAVNIDGFFCVVLSHLRGFINIDTVNRILSCMKSLLLPTNCSDLKLHLAWQSCKDAIEHRHGEQRIPLITEIGESICVSDITEEELDRALNAMKQFMH